MLANDLFFGYLGNPDTRSAARIPPRNSGTSARGYAAAGDDSESGTVGEGGRYKGGAGVREGEEVGTWKEVVH